MDTNIKKYRDKHHRCIYCKYLDYKCIPGLGDHGMCKVSLRPLGSIDILYYRGMFCKYYKVNEGDL